jgi:protein-S-isoprenylcysteine O-methyltransferase Ste14
MSSHWWSWPVFVLAMLVMVVFFILHDIRRPETERELLEQIRDELRALRQELKRH